jgi:hypothetical protein
MSTPSVRTVQCYFCHRHFDVPAKAMSLSCPWCYRRVRLDDIVVKGECFAKALQTCGRIVVQPKGHVVASLIEGRMGVEVFGSVDGPTRSGIRMFIASGGRVRGNISAPGIYIEPGGTVAGGLMRIGVESDAAMAPMAAGPRRQAAGTGFDAKAAWDAGEKLRVVLTLRNGRAAGYSVR